MRTARRLLAAGFAAVLAASLAACEQAPPPPLSKLPAGARVLAFGDSLTSGVGGAGRSYPAMLAQMTGLDVVGAGVPGELSGQALARLGRVLERTRPRLVILCTGGNDILKKRPDEELERNLDRLVAVARENGAEIVMLSVPELSVFPMNHSAYARVADAHALWLEDEVLKRVLHDDRLKSDWIHPNADGYREIAGAVAALLERAGAI